MRVCKSPALGGRAIVCKACNHHHYIYNSCGHSHCPICQSIKREQWADKLKNELLNVPYVHMVFTLPKLLRPLARANKSIIYSLIMSMAWKTVKQLCSKPINLGALPGMISVLHTFGSDMKYHIHAHCLVTFGGIDKHGQWLYPTRKNKIAQYRKINTTYKENFLHQLRVLSQRNQLKYQTDIEDLIAEAKQQSWVVHNTPPTIDTGVLENYLARYINRIAVSKSRVEYLKTHQQVKLLFNDYTNQQPGKPAPKKYKSLDPLSFIHQFLQHVLPPYFQKCRRYGIHACATKKKYQDLLPQAVKNNGHTIRSLLQIISQLIKQNPFSCDKCQAFEYDIVLVKPDTQWIYQYLRLSKPRAPPYRKPAACSSIM